MHKISAMDVEALRQRLVQYGQEHLLEFWEELSGQEQEALFADLNGLDLDYVTQSFEKCTAAAAANGQGGKLDERMEPLPSAICGSVLNLADSEKKEYESLAFAKIAAGKMAILLLAGGQGTRLGVAYPKGMYDVGLPSAKSLFQLQAERIVKLEQLANQGAGKSTAGKIRLYIMTSASTVEPTTAFFREHNYFGLCADQVCVFQQGTLPCFAFDGKILLDSKSALARAPDGNGGLYRALGGDDGILEDMTKRGVEFVQLYCVDNVLVRVGDPVFSGYCLSKGAECGNKVVAKGFPQESVGITCKVDGKYQVVEYSEISDAAAQLRNEDDGALTYSAANICIHFFTRAFLERVVKEHEKDLVHHVAKKKIPFVQSGSGERVKPEAPNGIKMEKFVFDVFQFADEDKFAVWECVREDEFAPLKNAPGASDFSPAHCRNAVYALHQKYVTAAGGTLVDAQGLALPAMISPAAPKERKPSNNNITDSNNNKAKGQRKLSKEAVVCEISPLVSYAGEGLQYIVDGKQITVPANNLGLDQLAN